MSDSFSRKHKKIVIPRKKKVAFICSGGAAKAGAFHLGVALALQEKGFTFQGGLKRELPPGVASGSAVEAQALTFSNSTGREISIYVGSSAGSIICTYLASGHSLDSVIDTFVGRKASPFDNYSTKELKRLSYNVMFSLRKDVGFLGLWNTLAEARSVPGVPNALQKIVGQVAKDSFDNLFKWKWLKMPGFFSTDGIEKYIREDVVSSNDFQSYAPDLFICATQLNHSKKVVFGKYNYSPPNDDKTVVYMNNTSISEACAASTALPPIYAPYAIANERGHKMYYFDGEIRDTLSTHVGYDAGADLIISSYTHQPYHFSREIGSLHEYGIPLILIQALYLIIERRIQSVTTTQERNKAALEATKQFFKEQNLSDTLANSCLDMLERQLGYKRGVDYIYIHPKPTDHQMFFGDHFNLSVQRMGEYVKTGFKSAVDVLRKYHFE